MPKKIVDIYVLVCTLAALYAQVVYGIDRHVEFHYGLCPYLEALVIMFLFIALLAGRLMKEESVN